ncbi:MAG TPA: hypothetical protein VL383_13950 [Gemmatimonadaceae bacterium]|jgi:hypothetical protein|nr:hypothetical protein [Gemmatimonadaceae bacterium]
MTGHIRFALALVALFSQRGAAQARVVSAPPEPSLLSITRDWARASSLGDLRELRTSSDYLELRVWGGYGFGMTQGVVLRRAAGHWSAFLARVRRCAIQIPIAVGDTASAATMRRYVAETRRQCDTPLGDVAAGMRIITADTLAVDALGVPDSVIDGAWAAAVHAGVLQLPGHIKHAGTQSSDFTYVVELRRGDEYRASELEHLEQPEMEVDRQIKEVYAAVSRVLPPELLVKPGPPGTSIEQASSLPDEDS